MTVGQMSIHDRKAREFQRREEDILKAALALSNRDDWQAVTIEQIAQKAEIGKGTVYKHFPSKDAHLRPSGGGLSPACAAAIAGDRSDPARS